MSIRLVHNQNIINRSVNFINNLNEQTLPSFEKVQSFSKSYMASYLSKALVASAVLSYLGFSFSTAFPICLALIVFTSFISFAIDSIKEAMHALVQKIRECLTRVAQVISDIFEAICAFISSFALQAICLKEKALSFAFDKKLPINQAVVANEPFIEEAQIQEGARTVRLAVSQREIPEIEKKAKKSEILSKFNQLCAETPNLLFFQQSYTCQPIPSNLKTPFQTSLSTPKRLIAPRTTLIKSNRNLEAQELIMASPSISTLNSSSIKLGSSIRLGMRALNLARSIK
ncbi:hypothetical protein [Candidatus Rhabdochlamydia sp. T3358]|uniref:hypothetical protein n=1 Tax=Candidatus Rhabdochlamydia sp. T3358 TaxID=2099795 RepID=UPI0010B771D6|nr:hypothetical protein [Candidatus Rhabdochlamydia sp. T3358]VHO02869.1 hypothetical protein RHT_00702 [Candidatus Rhabdochlamydia sp. T3358]